MKKLVQKRGPMGEKVDTVSEIENKILSLWLIRIDINFTNWIINSLQCEANRKKCGTFNGSTSCELKFIQYTRNLFFIFFSAQARTSFPIFSHGSCLANFWQVVDAMFPQSPSGSSHSYNKECLAFKNKSTYQMDWKIQRV